MSDPEFITILEGPTPEFKLAPDIWNISIYEGPVPSDITLCELRTFNGDDIRARSIAAWRDGRRVQLDFPDELRMRQHLDVVAMRLIEGDAGVVLRLWLHQPTPEGEEVGDEDSDDIDLD